MQYSRSPIFEFLDPHKCDMRYTFLHKPLTKSLDKETSKGKILAKSSFSHDRSLSTLQTSQQSWLPLEIAIHNKNQVTPEAHKAKQNFHL